MENWVQQGRQEAEQRELESKRNAARKLIALTEMNDQLIAEIEELPIEEVDGCEQKLSADPTFISDYPASP